MNSVIFDGVSSADFGMYVGLNGNDNAPPRSVETIVVPGRNGTLTIDNGRFENIEIEFICFIRRYFEKNIISARNFYTSRIGYKRLEDSAHPDEFRMARYVSGLEVTPSQMRKQGYFTLKFDAMPQRFLAIGENTITAVSDNPTMSLYNPTQFDSHPLIRVYGNGTLYVDDVTITIATESEYVDIDCETLDCYHDATNENGNVTFSDHKFPVLIPGDNTVAFDGEITRVDVTPRWWRI